MRGVVVSVLAQRRALVKRLLEAIADRRLVDRWVGGKVCKFEVANPSGCDTLG